MLNTTSRSNIRDMNGGFSFIELLVALALIGILASIAISQFATYKGNAQDTSALSDFRNMISAQEAYFVDNSSFLACSPSTTACESALANTGFNAIGPSTRIEASLVGGGTGWSGFAGAVDAGLTCRHGTGWRYSFSTAIAIITQAKSYSGLPGC